jgi:hypothetical protein
MQETSEVKKLDFGQALKIIVSEELRGNNPVPDVLGFLHIKHLLGSEYPGKLERLLIEYGKKICSPHSLLKIDVPKANFTIRPMARPTTEDWLIYEAVIDHLSEKIVLAP